MDIAVEKAANRLGITPTQVIFLWVKAKGAVIVTSVIYFLFIYLFFNFYVEFLSIPDVDLSARALANNV